MHRLAAIRTDASPPGEDQPASGGGHASRTYRRYALAWLGMALLGPVNGIARELLYRDRMGEFRSHQASSVSAIGLFAIYTWRVERRWPIESQRIAFRVGAMWLLLTVAFEFSFGRLVDRKGWGELLADYNLARGRLWPLVLLWLVIAPGLIRGVLESRTQAGCRS